jgi:hypothetical protein
MVITIPQILRWNILAYNISLIELVWNSIIQSMQQSRTGALSTGGYFG